MHRLSADVMDSVMVGVRFTNRFSVRVRVGVKVRINIHIIQVCV